MRRSDIRAPQLPGLPIVRQVGDAMLEGHDQIPDRYGERRRSSSEVRALEYRHAALERTLRNADELVPDVLHR